MDPALYQAIRDGNLGFFQSVGYVELLKVTADQEDTALHVAVNFGRRDIANRIIDRCRSLLHKTNSNGDSPLHVAARKGSQAIVQFLLDRANGIEVEMRNTLLSLRNHSKDTALHEAVRNGHLVVVSLLIVAEPHLTLAINNAGDSPLFLAVHLNFYQIAREIIRVCNHPDSFKGRNDMNVLHAAVIRAHKRRDKFSMKNMAINVIAACLLLHKCGFQFQPVFSYRIEYIGEGFMDTMRNSDESAISQPDIGGWIPLHYAAKVGHIEVFRVLLLYDVSLARVKTEKGKSAMHISARKGHSEIVQLLMDTCPDALGLLDNKGRTALHIAAEKGISNVVKTLLVSPQLQDHLINARDKNGNTPLQLAALRGHGDILSMLVNDARVNKMVENNAGLTTIDIIQSSTLFQVTRKSQIMRKLRANGAVKGLECAAIKKNKKEGDTKSSPEQDQSQKSERESQPAAGEKNENSISIHERSTFNLVVSTIIASITFSAIYNIPGGLSASDSNGEKIVKAALSEDKDFKGFILYNSIAFGIAFASVALHFIFSIFAAWKTTPNAILINSAFFLNYLSMAAMFCAYFWGLSALLPKSLATTVSLAAILSFVFSSILLPPICGFFYFLRDWLQIGG